MGGPVWTATRNGCSSDTTGAVGDQSSDGSERAGAGSRGVNRPPGASRVRPRRSGRTDGLEAPQHPSPGGSRPGLRRRGGRELASTGARSQPGCRVAGDIVAVLALDDGAGPDGSHRRWNRSNVSGETRLRGRSAAPFTWWPSPTISFRDGPDVTTLYASVTTSSTATRAACGPSKGPMRCSNPLLIGHTSYIYK
jgi:hypothetical protein